MGRQQSPNEKLVIKEIQLIEYYNRMIVPIDEKFRPMSEGRKSSLCPFHEDTDPSLHYWKEKNIFHCFGCGFGGDVVRTHMRLRRQYYSERLSIEQAVEQLARLFEIELLPEEEGFVVESVFDRARRILIDNNSYVIPKDVPSLVNFRNLNDKVRTMNMPLEAKVHNFEQLDLLTSVQLNIKN